VDRGDGRDRRRSALDAVSDTWSTSTGDGPLVVLTHGGADTADTWDHQVPALATHARVVTWDLLGHGRSAAPDDPAAYTHERAIEHLDALVGDERAVLVGHSFGGQLSIAYTLHHPGKVAGLGLLSTGPGFRDETKRAEWNARIEKVAAGHDARGDRGLGLAMRGFIAQHDTSIMDGVASITVPTLVLVGEKDRTFLAAADWFERALPHATKVVVADAGHAAHRHQPDAVNRALLDLLSAT
jgi:pimeloyl-ACP methyl ester carboxylesterase